MCWGLHAGMFILRGWSRVYTITFSMSPQLTVVKLKYSFSEKGLIAKEWRVSVVELEQPTHKVLRRKLDTVTQTRDQNCMHILIIASNGSGYCNTESFAAQGVWFWPAGWIFAMKWKKENSSYSIFDLYFVLLWSWYHLMYRSLSFRGAVQKVTYPLSVNSWHWTKAVVNKEEPGGLLLTAVFRYLVNYAVCVWSRNYRNAITDIMQIVCSPEHLPWPCAWNPDSEAVWITTSLPRVSALRPGSVPGDWCDCWQMACEWWWASVKYVCMAKC